jgi:hypothetical protein
MAQKEEPVMSRMRIVIISLAALVALGIVIAVLSFTGGDTAPSPTPPPIIDDEERFDLLRINIYDVRNVSFSREGASYTITSSGEALTLAASRALFPFNDSEVFSLFRSATWIPQVRRVAENADDDTIAEFGLADPLITWRITLNDGSVVEAALSDRLLARYIRIIGERDIYILSDLQADRLSRPIEELYDLSFLPHYIETATEEDPTWGWFMRAAVTTSERTIEIRRRGERFASGYRMFEPVETILNERTAIDSFLEPLTTINPTELIEISPSDLSKYGLDSPVRLELADEVGWSGTLLIGNRNEQDDGRYVMIEGANAVLLDRTGNYVFAETPYFRLRLNLIWVHDINDVRHVDYHLDDNVVRRLEFTHGDSNQDMRAQLDGRELTDHDARQIYSSVLSIIMDGETTAGIPNRTADYKFVITLLDGEAHTLELFALNERQYLIVLNDINQQLITFRTTLINNLLSKFELLDQGIELPFT